VLHKAERVIKNQEIQEQIEEAQEEIKELIEDSQKEISKERQSDDIKEIVQETQKRIVLKTYDAITDHDDLEETIKVE